MLKIPDPAPSWRRAVHHRTARLALVFILLIAGCGISPSQPEAPLPELRPGPPATTGDVPGISRSLQSFHDVTLGLSSYDDAKLQDIARCDMATFNIVLLLSEEAQPALQRLRELNPDIVFAGIVAVLSAKDAWVDPNLVGRFPLGPDLHGAYQGRYAYRTDGELATMWVGAPMVNPWLDGGVNERTLVNFVNVISHHASNYPGILDGIFHDYTSATPYLWPQPKDPSVGVDLDGDGIASFEDPDETAIWVGWQHRLVESLQAVFGPGLVQVANGRLPHNDTQFAGKLAGIHYERFPVTPWGYSAREGIELVIQHSQAGYLTPRRGRIWNHVLDVSTRRWDILRSTALLTGQSYSLWDDNKHPVVDPSPVNSGNIIGPLEMTELAGGGVAYSRAYELGTSRVEFSATGDVVSQDFISSQ